MKKIEINPKKMVGKAVIKGTRIPVYLILNLLAHDYNEAKIIEAYPELTPKDIKAALNYAENMTRYEEKIISKVTYA